MKNTIREIVSSLDHKFMEFLTFMSFILFGVMVKFIREKVKPTFKRILVEIAMSFFVGGIVYFSMVQFLELNNFFVFAVCSYAGSISSKFLDGLEKLFENVLKAIPEKIKGWKSNCNNGIDENLNHEA